MRPDSTVSELNFLDDAYDHARVHFKTDNAIIMGDLNADCSYLSRSEYKSLDLVTDERFHWLIDGNEDTTTKDTACAYDRYAIQLGLVWVQCVVLACVCRVCMCGGWCVVSECVFECVCVVAVCGVSVCLSVYVW